MRSARFQFSYANYVSSTNYVPINFFFFGPVFILWNENVRTHTSSKMIKMILTNISTNILNWTTFQSHIYWNDSENVREIRSLVTHKEWADKLILNFKLKCLSKPICVHQKIIQFKIKNCFFTFLTFTFEKHPFF